MKSNPFLDNYQQKQTARAALQDWSFEMNKKSRNRGCETQTEPQVMIVGFISGRDGNEKNKSDLSPVLSDYQRKNIHK